MSRSHAYELLNAARVINNLSATADTVPNSERVTRPLTKLEPDQQRECLGLAQQISPSPSAADVQRVAQTLDRLG
jgi:hypothetical protein